MWILTNESYLTVWEFINMILGKRNVIFSIGITSAVDGSKAHYPNLDIGAGCLQFFHTCIIKQKLVYKS